MIIFIRNLIFVILALVDVFKRDFSKKHRQHLTDPIDAFPTHLRFYYLFHRITQQLSFKQKGCINIFIQPFCYPQIYLFITSG
ncbi:hypothetical protein M472_13490 [Sphingobacterium paucimobilis HER1398]|uniref:Uncharacterized protein n=1 Tax=Sphingobacterium paucimobilis HER1398 TaxID=1346330 RepID=U2JAU4_9SPHI|nr:hypothetical protein M472_13490 [Sphingobacterium paucimobilis HER1398]